MAASWRNPGVLYVHNDRNALEFVAVSEQGATVGHFRLEGPGASGRDLEDMAVAKCPAGTCVYLADIGNNIAPLRSQLVIFRTAEPAIDRAAPSAIPVTLAFERFVFSYPDGGSHNAESLLIDPSAGTVYIIDKRAAGQPSAVYKLPALDASGTTVAVKVADLPVPMPADQPATSAAAQPCGAGFLLRTINSLYEFRIPPGAPFEEAFRVTPTRVPVAMEAQGEAVTYAPDGRTYYTTSERPSGPMAPINAVRCR
jgi:hypothetical protein